MTAWLGLSAAIGLPIVEGFGGVFAVTDAVVFIGNEKKSTWDRSIVPVVALAPISENVHAGKAFDVTSVTVGAVRLSVGSV